MPGSNEVNQTDHLLVSLRHSTSVRDVKRSSGPNFHIEHYLVKIKVGERVGVQKLEGVKPELWDVQKLQENKEIKKISEKN
jgi:hypothetical protein